MAHSVVSTSAAMDAAFCSAERVTLAGSMIPAFRRSPHAPVAALNPLPSDSPRIRSTTTAPSKPALAAISLAGSCRDLRTIERAGRLVA